MTIEKDVNYDNSYIINEMMNWEKMNKWRRCIINYNRSIKILNAS